MDTHALDRLGDEIAALSAHLDAATAHLLDLIREFDVHAGWNNGFRSCAHWLKWRVGLDLGAARERVRVARALGTLPLLSQALAKGKLSYAKVRALTRVARHCISRLARSAPRPACWSILGKRPRWSSSRPTRSGCSPRPRSITGSIPARRASAIRWWCTSTLPCSPTPISPVSPSSRTARAFPRKRRSAWRATRAAW